MNYECDECLHGTYIERDIDEWGWSCAYSNVPDDDECHEIYEYCENKTY